MHGLSDVSFVTTSPTGNFRIHKKFWFPIGNAINFLRCSWTSWIHHLAPRWQQTLEFPCLGLPKAWPSSVVCHRPSKRKSQDPWKVLISHRDFHGFPQDFVNILDSPSGAAVTKHVRESMCLATEGMESRLFLFLFTVPPKGHLRIHEMFWIPIGISMGFLRISSKSYIQYLAPSWQKTAEIPCAWLPQHGISIVCLPQSLQEEISESMQCYDFP